MLKEFKAFIARGNLIDLAVAFVLAAAFAQVVFAFTQTIIDPLLGLVFGKSNLGSLAFALGKAQIQYGFFLDALISFIIVGFVLFLVVKAYNRFRVQEGVTMKSCSFCQTEIPLAASRCPNCTSQLQGV